MNKFRNIERTQPETIKIVNPFIAYMRENGWVCKNIHGSQFQKGLPDYYCFKEGRHLWIEFKVCAKSGHVKLQPAQKVVFREMYAHDLPVYIVGDYDLRGNDRALRTHYLRVTRGKPNINLTFEKILMKDIPSGHCRWVD